MANASCSQESCIPFLLLQIDELMVLVCINLWLWFQSMLLFRNIERKIHLH